MECYPPLIAIPVEYRAPRAHAHGGCAVLHRWLDHPQVANRACPAAESAMADATNTSRLNPATASWIQIRIAASSRIIVLIMFFYTGKNKERSSRL